MRSAAKERGLRSEQAFILTQSLFTLVHTQVALTSSSRRRAACSSGTSEGQILKDSSPRRP
jgi:hypothetical protein